MAGTPPRLQTARSLWAATLFFPALAGAVLAAPLLGTFPEGGEWNRIGAALVVGGSFGAVAVAVGASHLSELARRGAWVPPGAARHPVLAAAAVAGPLMAAGCGAMWAFVRGMGWLSALGGR